MSTFLAPITLFGLLLVERGGTQLTLRDPTGTDFKLQVDWQGIATLGETLNSVLVPGQLIAGLGMRLPGSAPAAPVDGDVWITSAGLYARINGVTVGPFSTQQYVDARTPNITASTTAPANPAVNDIWIDVN
jgi:hypothetical protein